MKRILLKCSLTLLVAHFLLLGVFNYVPGYLPIFGTREVNVHGMIGFVAMVLIIRFYLKRYIWEDPEVSLGELVSIGLLGELFAQAILQLARQFTMEDVPQPVRVVDYFGSILAMSIVAGAISLYIAGRLKQNGGVRIISVVLWIGLGFAYRWLHASGIL